MFCRGLPTVHMETKRETAVGTACEANDTVVMSDFSHVTYYILYGTLNPARLGIRPGRISKRTALSCQQQAAQPSQPWVRPGRAPSAPTPGGAPPGGAKRRKVRRIRIRIQNFFSTCYSTRLVLVLQERVVVHFFYRIWTLSGHE